ncbi:tachykinin-like peptides receptor 99D [Schistocerca serialis cubense]|uniref:tachykinin-like peptides receptor 99D n=1 Tax=Schistocerca serialis cubense TaxID=2023355 RepID=UPI00214F2565|nr:tachykinin-like peptides receptor 99D [Schistocerca serialis cubense]
MAESPPPPPPPPAQLFLENATWDYDEVWARALANGSAAGASSLFEVPAGVIVLLSVCYGSISVVAVLGNALVIWIVATSRRMQNVTNCFIANLALADIVIGLFAIPFQFQAALLQRWNLPHFMCAFCPFVQVLSVNVSVFTLTAIAVDRHRAILSPLSGRPSKVLARLVVGAIWAAGALLAAPMAAALGVSLLRVQGAAAPVPFCHNVRLSERAMLAYRLLLVALQYATPLCVITAVYARMALRLWGQRAPGNAQDTRDAALVRNKKKVIKMLVIVVALFALCWLPLQTYNLLQDIYPQINGYHYINIIWFCCDWLAMSNSCYNPFVYGIYNEKFQREFRLRLRGCCRQLRPSAEVSEAGGRSSRRGRELSDLEALGTLASKGAGCPQATSPPPDSTWQSCRRPPPHSATATTLLLARSASTSSHFDAVAQHRY